MNQQEGRLIDDGAIVRLRDDLKMGRSFTSIRCCFDSHNGAYCALQAVATVGGVCEILISSEPARRVRAASPLGESGSGDSGRRAERWDFEGKLLRVPARTAALLRMT